MTPNDTASDRDERGNGLRDIALAAVGATGALFGTGFLAGFSMAVIEGSVRHPVRAAVIAVVAAAIVAGSAMLLRRVLPNLMGGEVSPRIRKARGMLYLSMGVGAVLGAVLMFSQTGGDGKTLDPFNGPVSPGIALVAIAVWLIAVPILSWVWWRNIDEHEALAYKDGSLVGIYAYSFLAPSWWMAWRAGLMPAPDYMLTFLIVITVWGIGWAVRRFA